MHANAALLNRLFAALQERDPVAMASCYDREARFRDIAFDLEGRGIADMWRMICCTCSIVAESALILSRNLPAVAGPISSSPS